MCTPKAVAGVKRATLLAAQHGDEHENQEREGERIDLAANVVER